MSQWTVCSQLWNSWCLTRSNIHFAKLLHSAVYFLQSSYLPIENLSYLQLLLAVVFPVSGFSIIPPTFLLCHASVFILHCFYFHASMRITSPLLISGLASVQNAVCKWWLCYNNLLWSGRYGASTPSAHLFPLVTTHFLILYAFPYK